jgi:hypothetical protein
MGVLQYIMYMYEHLQQKTSTEGVFFSRGGPLHGTGLVV